MTDKATGVRFNTQIEINETQFDVEVYAAVHSYNPGNEHEPPSGPEVEVLRVIDVTTDKAVDDWSATQLEGLVLIEFDSD